MLSGFRHMIRRTCGRLVLWALAPVAVDLVRLHVIAREVAPLPLGGAHATTPHALDLYGAHVVASWRIDATAMAPAYGWTANDFASHTLAAEFSGTASGAGPVATERR